MAVVIGGCQRPMNLAPPARDDVFTAYLSARLGGSDPLPDCAVRGFDLEATAPVEFARLRLHLELPTGFVPGPRELLIEPVRHPAIPGEWGGNQWLPGFYITPAWYRWTRSERAAKRGPTAPTTLVQIHNWRSFQMFLADPPWTLTEGEECALRLPGRTARVLRFTARHPVEAPQWGVVAYWRGRPGDGFLTVFALGPDPAVQAEVLEVIRRHRP